jgi:hypothetical protein
VDRPDDSDRDRGKHDQDGRTSDPVVIAERLRVDGVGVGVLDCMRGGLTSMPPKPPRQASSFRCRSLALGGRRGLELLSARSARYPQTEWPQIALPPTGQNMLVPC